MNRKFVFALPLLLSGCNTIYGWADDVGKHMPTIGNSCNNWQCITESGQRKSEENKWLDDVSEKQPVPKAAPQTTPQTPPITK